MAEEFHGSGAFTVSALTALPVWLAAAGVLTAYIFFKWKPALADSAERSFKWLHTILINKYGFDWFNENVIAAGARALGGGLWRFGDQDLIDDGLVNGSARVVGWFSSVMRYAQSGLSISLCIRDDPGSGLAAALADVAPMMLNDHLLEVLIWLPMAGGFLVLGLGDRPSAARWVSLGVSDRHVRVQHPLVGMVQDRHGGDAIR